MQHQRFARVRINAIGVTGCGQQFARILDGSAYWLALSPVKYVMVVMISARLMAEDFRWDRALSRYTAAVEENADKLFIVNNDGNGTPQFARLGVVATNHVIKHIEAGVINRRGHRGLQLDVPRA